MSSENRYTDQMEREVRARERESYARASEAYVQHTAQARHASLQENVIPLEQPHANAWDLVCAAAQGGCHEVGTLLDLYKWGLEISGPIYQTIGGMVAEAPSCEPPNPMLLKALNGDPQPAQLTESTDPPA